MQCTTPLTLREPHPDRPNRRLVSRPFDSFDNAKVFSVPCGQCQACLLNKAGDFAVRGYHESKLHESNLFLTLTYSDEHLPADMSVSVAVHQQFMRRYRYFLNLGEGEGRFVMSAEYGTLRQRAHYHYIMFGLALPDLRPWSRSGSGEVLYRSEFVETKLWPFGIVYIGAVTLESIGYVCRYTLKKAGRFDDPDGYNRFNELTGEFSRVQPEFWQASRRPGIGVPWYQRFKSDFFPSDFCIVDGRRKPVPRLYLDKLAAEAARDVKIERRRKGEEHAAMYPEERSTSRMMAKHEMQRLRARKLIRSMGEAE